MQLIQPVNFQLYTEDCLDTMARFGDEVIDLVLTSPPYDGLRKYNGYVFDFEATAKEIYRTLKQGGVCVWNVGDEVKNGSESGTSFRQALYFIELGLNLHDTMIYKKNSSAYPSNKNSSRYTQIFEYMFVFSKGKPKTVNLIIDKKNKYAGQQSFDKTITVSELSPRENIWEYSTGFNDKTGHPAVMPEQMAIDHILTWTNERDFVYDPFGGSGTTAKGAIQLNRDWAMSEISKEYASKAFDRLYPLAQQLKLI